MIAMVLLILAILIQIWGAILALRLIPIARRRLPCVLIAATFSVRAVRLLMGLWLGLYAGHPLSVLEEGIALAVSILALAGIHWIRPLLLEHRHSLKEQKRLLRELRQEAVAAEEERLRLHTLIENLPVGIFFIDRTGKILETNAMVDCILGGPAPHSGSIAEYREYYRGWRCDTGKQVAPEEWAAARAVTQGETTLGEMVDIERLDGTIGTIMNNAAPLRDARGEITGAVVVILDLTEQRRAEAELRENRNLLNSVIEGTSDAIYVKDCSGRYLLFNSAAESLTGKKASEIVGKDDTALFPPGESEPLMERDREILATGVNVTLEEKLTDSRGRKRIFFTTKGPVRDARGRITGLFGISREITAAKEAELALKESEERFRSTFEQAAVGMLNAGTDGRLLRVNDRFCEITGYTREELLGKTFSEITWPEDVARGEELNRKLLAGEIPHYTREKRYRRKDGTPLWVNLTVSLMRDMEGKPRHSIAVVEDISDRRRLETELREAKERAEEATRAKSEFLAHMSHEIRTPMTIIIGSLEHLSQGEMEPDNQTIVEMASTAAERLLSLLNNTLDFSRIEAGKIEIEEEPFNVATCVSKILRIFELKAKQRKVRLGFTISPEVPEVVLGSPDRIGQILINLVGNALKFTEGGEVAVTVSPDPERGGHILFSVRDTGIGIPAGKIHLLFESFSQLNGSRSARYGGSGLGLAISKGLVELMGGTIWAESIEGQGSTFSFSLPLRGQEQP